MLLAIVLYQAIGYVVTFHFEKEYFEEAFEQSGRHENMQRLAVPVSAAGNALVQTEASEIVYKGNLFDFDRKELKGDSIIFYGRYDGEEEQWLRQDANQPEAMSSMPVKKSLQFDFLSLFCAKQDRKVFQSNINSCMAVVPPAVYEFNFKTHISDIPVPPPQV